MSRLGWAKKSVGSLLLVATLMLVGCSTGHAGGAPATDLEFEKIAVREPDLIVGTHAGMTEKDFQMLSAIAPTATATATAIKDSLQYSPRGATRLSRSPAPRARRRTARRPARAGTSPDPASHPAGSDVVVFATESPNDFAELKAFGSIGNLPAVTERRSVYTTATLAGAI